MRRTHIVTALILIPVCLFCIFWLIPNNTVPPTSEVDVSPGFVPNIALGIVAFYSLIMLVRELRTPDVPEDELDDEFGSEATGVDGKVLLNTLIFTLASFATWFAIRYVGFEPAGTVLIAVAMYFMGSRNWLLIGLCALVLPWVLSLSTFHFFSTELPGFWR